jgi:Ser/Thr protein kinase RdoA (MazF antagonist)
VYGILQMSENTKSLLVIESVPLNFQIRGTEEEKQNNLSVTAIGGGLINDTYLVNIFSASPDGEFGNIIDESYVLQRINTDVFSNIDELMNNIDKVSRHLQTKNGSHGRYLSIIPTNSGRHFWKCNEKGAWRMFNYIPNSISYPLAPNGNFLYEAGRAYGKFQFDLHDFSASELYETIPDFHNTKQRMDHFRKAVDDDKFGRTHAVKKEISYLESQSKLASIIVDLMNQGMLPRRVTHNDTKLENVLFDVTTNKAICVVDYDTIMSGSMLFDFGDAIRSMANQSAEDEIDISKVKFDINAYENFTQGYLKEVATVITDAEKKFLHMGAIVLTFEQTLRFLTDFLLGDVYFKIDCLEHNMIRARNQLELLKGMLAKKDEMSISVKKFCNQ